VSQCITQNGIIAGKRLLNELTQREQFRFDWLCYEVLLNHCTFNFAAKLVIKHQSKEQYRMKVSKI
jgi:hypothetical protein